MERWEAANTASDDGVPRVVADEGHCRREPDTDVMICDATSSEVEMVRRLERTGRFRVLRATPDLPPLAMGAMAGDIAVGVAIDVETTGLNVGSAEVIELGMVRFGYDRRDGRILGAIDSFSGLRQPWSPIPAEVTRLTGIDDAMVAGQEIDADEVAGFVRDVDLVVAHNAWFDRPFAEARWAAFSRLPWACSCTEVGWAQEGYDGAKLGHLLMQAGWFHPAHRAVDDARAILHLLSLPLPTSGRTGLSALLERASAPAWRVWAERAPFALKDVLKRRAYRWSNGDSGLPRSWYRDLPEEAVDAEVEFLLEHVFHDGEGGPRVVSTTALDRFTLRAGVTGRRSA